MRRNGAAEPSLRTASMRGALWNNHPRAYRYDLSAKATCRKPAQSCVVRSRSSLGCRQIRFGRIGTSLPDVGFRYRTLGEGYACGWAKCDFFSLSHSKGLAVACRRSAPRPA
jgi:hypothetical protein